MGISCANDLKIRVTAVNDAGIHSDEVKFFFLLLLPTFTQKKASGWCWQIFLTSGIFGNFTFQQKARL